LFHFIDAKTRAKHLLPGLIGLQFVQAFFDVCKGVFKILCLSLKRINFLLARRPCSVWRYYRSRVTKTVTGVGNTPAAAAATTPASAET
jgi:hypothetical protein